MSETVSFVQIVTAVTHQGALLYGLTTGVLKKLLVGRLVFRQTDEGTYEFSGQASVGRILAGIAGTKAGVAPTGFEPVFRP